LFLELLHGLNKLTKNKILNGFRRNQKAIENLNRAIEQFRECGADGWIER
jgi:hypothetical protein